MYFHVIAFKALGENAAASLRKGSTVTVTGHLTDASYTPPGSDQPVRRQRLEAQDIAVSLRYATATVTKRAAGQRAEEPPADEPAA